MKIKPAKQHHKKLQDNELVVDTRRNIFDPDMPSRTWQDTGRTATDTTAPRSKQRRASSTADTGADGIDEYLVGPSLSEEAGWFHHAMHVDE